MKLKDFLKELNDYIERHPELLEYRMLAPHPVDCFVSASSAEVDGDDDTETVIIEFKY